jgi:hypothetical protein
MYENLKKYHDSWYLIPSSIAKKTKTNDDLNSSSYDIVTIHSDKESDNTSFEL